MKIEIYCYLIADILTQVLQKCLLSAYHFSPNLSICLVAMVTERLNLRKKILKKL